MNIKINTKEIMNKRAIISYLEIFLLVGSLFAVSYIFYEITDGIYGVSNGVGIVDAQASGNVCCEETINGQSCQMSSADQCNRNFAVVPGRCEDTSFCTVGCCISSNTGLCSQASSKRDCEKINGTFAQGASCNVAACKKGCCVLGNQAKWTTEQNCKFEGNSEHNEVKTEWRYDESSDSELKCLFSVEKDKEGACIFTSSAEKKCVYTTLQECVSRTGSEVNFNRDGKFCSDPALNTTCKAKDHTACIDGKEDVYWFDSCGNKESLKQDCNLFGGTYCGTKNNEAICKNIDCDTNGDGSADRKNGESWCSYDGTIGNGKDVVGSRHIKHVCYFGSERLGPCADFRNEICVQEDSTLEGGKTFSQAACRVNQWRSCMNYNREKDDALKNKCTKNPDCRFKNINMGGSFNFNVCLPSYPPGFDIAVENMISENGELNQNYYQASSSDGICSSATQRCTEIWKCGIFGCVCIDNCQCHTASFTTEMNDFCTSLGDCGAKANYAGVTTDEGYTIAVKGGKGPPRLSVAQLNAFAALAQKKAGQKAAPGTMTFFQTLQPELLPEVGSEKTNISAFEKELQAASGAYGSPLLLKLLTSKNDSGVFENLASISTGNIGLAGYSGAVASIGAAVSAQIQPGEQKEKKDMSMIFSMVAGLIAYVITQSIIITMIASLIGFLFALSWIKKVDIDFTCMPWQAPDGGDACNRCNQLDVPCTEYRCESLGSLCQLANAGTSHAICVSKPANETLPRITPFESVLSTGYAYTDVTDKGFAIVNATSKECIEPYTTVEFGIKVDPFARCRIGNNSRADFSEMSELFGVKGNYILPAHVTKLFFPNPEAFKNVYNLSAAQIEALGQWDLYVKCKTASGKINPDPYHIHTCIKPGPDLTPPRVTLVQPLSGTNIAFGTETKEITLYVNEPSQCKWSTRDETFDLMPQNLTCEIDPAVFTQYGWKCLTTLSGLQNTTKFFIKCQDTSENKNTMSESFLYSIFSSKSMLAIQELLPKDSSTITTGVERASVKLKAKTIGGVNGAAFCAWVGNGFSDSFRYNGNSSTIHEYNLNLPQGGYSINVSCEDIAGNRAENITRFTIAVDVFGPKISRAYYDSGLTIKTSEKAECRYSFNRQFIFENATKMSGDGFEHLGGWALQTYYVQCKDQYNNKGNIMQLRPVN